MLALTEDVYLQMVAHCLDGYPLEACGLLSGTPDDGRGPARATACHLTANAAGSARIYEVAPRDLLHADRAAEAAGTQLIGVFHSHTHTEGRPSPTDVAQAPDPGWHYVLVSLRDTHPMVRSFRIAGGKIEEELLVLQ